MYIFNLIFIIKNKNYLISRVLIKNTYINNYRVYLYSYTFVYKIKICIFLRLIIII